MPAEGSLLVSVDIGPDHTQKEEFSRGWVHVMAAFYGTHHRIPSTSSEVPTANDIVTQ